MESDWIISSPFLKGSLLPQWNQIQQGDCQVETALKHNRLCFTSVSLWFCNRPSPGEPCAVRRRCTLGLLSQAFTARGWACFVLFGGHYVIPALASSASVQGACVGCALVNWMCSPNSREHPRGAPQAAFYLRLMWPMYMAPWATCPLQRLGFCFLGIKNNFFGQATGHVGPYNCDQGSNLQPPWWKLRVLTTE